MSGTAKKAAAAPKRADEQNAPKGDEQNTPAENADKSTQPPAENADGNADQGGAGDPGTTTPDGPDTADEVKAAEGDQGGEQRTPNEPQNGDPAHSGPGTGTPAPPESTYRMPSTVVTDPQGAPLDPPSDTPTQTDPEQGYNKSSTDHVWAEAGRQTIAGEDFVGLVDDEDNPVGADDLFEDDPVNGKSKTFVLGKQRVYEVFYYPNTTEKAKRLLFAKGKKVPRAQAERIKAAIENAPTPAVEQG